MNAHFDALYEDYPNCTFLFTSMQLKGFQQATNGLKQREQLLTSRNYKYA